MSFGSLPFLTDFGGFSGLQDLFWAGAPDEDLLEETKELAWFLLPSTGCSKLMVFIIWSGWVYSSYRLPFSSLILLCCWYWARLFSKSVACR